MTDQPYILDASALLAAFFNEPGADHVAQRMSGALPSAVNYAEVIAKLIDRGTPRDQILGIMAQLDAEVVPVDRDQATRSGLLRDKTRGAGLSLGERMCLALAIARNGIALTTDRTQAELDVGATVEVAR